MFKNILLAVDGSPTALRAAKVAGQMAHEMNARLWLVIAYEPVPPFIGEPYFQNAMAKRVLDAQKILDKSLKVLGKLPVDPRTEILEGPPAEAILAVAETRKSDLIVMGSRGLGTLTGILLGSQSQKVLQHAKVPVMIIR